MSLIVKVGKKAKGLLKSAGLLNNECNVTYVGRIERVKTNKKICAMTFDDGPMNMPASPDSFDGRAMTDVLLDTLKKYSAHATFDIVGYTGDNYPDKAGKPGSAAWGGLKFDHYPDINCDDKGGAVNCSELVQRMIDEGHELSNHGYRHIIFGKKPFVYGAREHFNTIDEVISDLSQLHNYIKNNFNYEMKLSRPPHYVDKIGKCFTSYNAYELMDYGYMAASYDGGGWLPSAKPDQAAAQLDEVNAMIAPMEAKLKEAPDFFCGQIIFQKDGYNMAKRTPIAYALDKQLELLYKYGYTVVSVSELMQESPFKDVGRECDIFEELVNLAETHAIAYSDNTLRLGNIMTNYEYAMLVTPREMVVNKRIDDIKNGGRYISEYDCALNYAKSHDLIDRSAKGKEAYNGQTRYEVLKAYAEKKNAVLQK